MDRDIVKRFIYGAKEAYKQVDNHSFNFPITIESAYRLATNIEKLLKEQEEKTGHWIQSNPKFVSAKATGGSRISTCSNCGGWGRKSFSFCPHCGVKIKQEGR